MTVTVAEPPPETPVLSRTCQWLRPALSCLARTGCEQFTSRLRMESLQKQKSPQDDSIIEVLRQQLEQIMKLWIEIFQQNRA